MLKPFEKLFAMAMLAYGCGAFELLLVGPTQRLSPAETNTAALAAQIGFHVVASLFYILHAKKLTLAIVRTPWLITIALFAVLSTAWSQDPNLTFRRSLLLIGTILFGLYFGSRFELREQIHILAWTLLAVLMASAALAIVAPSMGVDGGGHFGNWRGLFHQKNMLSRVACLAVIVFLMWRPSFRAVRPFAIVFAIVVLVMTRSATGMVVCLCLFVVMQVIRVARLQPTNLVPIAVVLLALGALLGITLASNSAVALSVLGRDASLTGRTQLWQAVLVSISKRPILGYGFDAFWLGVQGESGQIVRTVRWMVIHAHNGILDLWLNLGAIGLALSLIAYSVCVRKSLRFYVMHRSHLRAWPLAYMAFIFFYNATEVTALEQDTIFTMLFAAVAVAVTWRTFEMGTNDDEHPTACDCEADPIYLSR
jgi:O-antigen ligase